MLHDIDAFSVQEVPCGCGMISKRDLFAGTIVLKEKPIAILRASTLQAAGAQVWPELAELRKQWHLNRCWPEEIEAPPEVIQRFAGTLR